MANSVDRLHCLQKYPFRGLQSTKGYRKSGNFRENFIFANGVKRHICDV